MRELLRKTSINVRKSNAGDAEYLSRFSDCDIDGRDTVLIAEIKGQAVGLLALRSIPLVHGFHVERSMVSRKIADALLQYAKGFVNASGYQEACLFVDPRNEDMTRWVEEHGARVEDVAQVYTIEVK